MGPNEVPTKKARNPHGQGATNTTCLLPEVLNSSSLSTLLERRFSPLNARICFWRLYLRHELGSCGQRACLGGLREPTARTGGHQGAVGPRWPCFPRVNRKGSSFLKGASPGGKRAGAPGCLVPTPPHSGWGCRPPATPHLCTRILLRRRQLQARVRRGALETGPARQSRVRRSHSPAKPTFHSARPEAAAGHAGTARRHDACASAAPVKGREGRAAPVTLYSKPLSLH